jgi:hypothetical protein
MHLHHGDVKRIDLGSALALLLMADTQREIEQRAKAVLERGIARAYRKLTNSPRLYHSSQPEFSTAQRADLSGEIR